MTDPRQALIDAVRALISRAVPAAKEEVKWNAPSFATTEHFATFNLRAKEGVLLVLHLGAKPRRDVDMRTVIRSSALELEWKGPDRAVVTVRDAAHLARVRTELARVLKAWSKQVV